MGNECSACTTTCQKKDEIQNEVQQGTIPHMNSYSQQPNDDEEQLDGFILQVFLEMVDNHERNQVQLSQHSEQLKEIQQKYEESDLHKLKDVQEDQSPSVSCSLQNQVTPVTQQAQTQDVKVTAIILTNESISKEKDSQTKKLSQYQEDKTDISPVQKNSVDQREKRPLFQFKSGAQYSGSWKGSMRDGAGTQIWPDGAKYEGEWRDNKANGIGKFWHVDGDYFEGEWKDDKANGQGMYIHTNGARYEGEWKEDLQDGTGVETWTDGSKYNGSYRLGKKQGQGTYFWNDGSKYMGQWADNRIQGFGQYSWLDGRKYEGYWINNTMHGRGIYTWKDGRKYEGEYDRDKKHGYGQYVWNDGRIYEGFWGNGKQNGKGRYILPDGTKKMGLWEDGKRIKWLDGEENAILKPENWDELKLLSAQQKEQK